MNIIAKSALVLLAASSITGVAMAAPGDGTYGQINQAQANIKMLSAKIEKLGGKVGDVNVNPTISPVNRAHALEAKESSLQMKLNALQAQKS